MELQQPDLTTIGASVLAKRYLVRNEEGEVIETAQERFVAVAKHVAQAERNYGVDPETIWPQFYKLMATRDFVPNTPCLVNAGRADNPGQLSACFVLPIEDSMESVFQTLKDMAMIHKTGGGTGFSFSRLRPAGDFVKSTTGIASGPVSFMHAYNHVTECVKQAGVRRGANMGVLRVDHPDILQFIDCKRNLDELCNFNISVGITDAFMAAVKADEEYELVNPHTGKVVGKLRARDVWNKIITNAHHSGEPGLFFIDRVNTLDPLSEKLGPIEAPNPCVTGDTRVLTRLGFQRIDELVEYDHRIEVWNGEAWSSVQPKQTGKNQPIVRVKLSNGHSLTCTLYHRFYLADGTAVEAQNLRVGDRLEKLVFSAPTEGSRCLPHAYAAGFYQGDGFYNTEKKQQQINFCAEKIKVARKLEAEGIVRLQSYSEMQDRIRGTLNHPVPEKGSQLPFDTARENVLQFLAGLLDSDGCLVWSDADRYSYSYQITSVNHDFLLHVQLLVRQLGIPSSFGLMKEAETKLLPGGYYDCQDCWRLSIPASGAVRLIDMGLKTYRLEMPPNQPRREALQFPKVTAVIPAGIADKVYCFTESERHRGVFDGIITGQCGEVPLRAFDACCLGGLNLSNFYIDREITKTIDFDRLATTIRTAVRFLDDMLDMNQYPVAQIHEVTRSSRKIGLGVMGWADLLVKLSIPYASEQALDLAEQVMRFVNGKAIEASQELATLRGPFPLFEDSKHFTDGCKHRRNATCTVIAPTGTTAIIAGCSSGIEPLFAIVQTRKQAEMTMVDVNPVFEEIAKREGFYNEALMTRVRENGTLADDPDVPDRWQRVFHVANEISPDYHVKMQAAFQRHVEDGVSKTINLAQDADIATVERAYQLAWDEGCKGITVYRDKSRENQTLTLGADTSATRPELHPIPTTPYDAKVWPIKTPTGKLSVKLCLDDGRPFETWFDTSRPGTAIHALSEALGRLGSLVLRMDSPIDPMHRVELIADQLIGLGGGDSVGFGPDRVLSMPDGAAKALRVLLGALAAQQVPGESETPKVPEGQKSPPPVVVTPSNGQVVLGSLQAPVKSSSNNGNGNGHKHARSFGDICPDCHQVSLYYGEGCAKCALCGFARC